MWVASWDNALRWWAFALAMLCIGYPHAARAATQPLWSRSHARVTSSHGYPVFTVDGKPFFVDGAAFFYERIPRERWDATLRAYKRLGINTIDLYLIWNWHEPQAGVRDFDGHTDPRRDLIGLLRLTHALGFKLILRPGPVIRNEWRNGGYPAWLLERPEYAMPLHDVLEGRYPATATLQNAHADAAAAEWLANATHRRYAAAWLHDVLTVTAPYAHDVIAIALDDDQGAYIDNDTWPAPHWHAYIQWLAATVRDVTGPRVPLFVNTYEMKVPAASPAWAWGNWYQSDAYAIGAHDLADLDFATGLLQTQARRPLMQAEFQAGWLQGADEAMPRPADPANTALALGELLRDGAHGIVNFPLQDTIYPDGWEVPWANHSYAWDAALTVDLQPSPRYAPTAAFGSEVRRYGALLAQTHVAADAAIVWPPSLFDATATTNADFAAFEAATIAMQRQCNARRLACTLVDLAFAGDATLRRYPAIVMPMAIPPRLARFVTPAMRRRLAHLRVRGLLVDSLTSKKIRSHLDAPDATLLIGDDDRFAFVAVVNPSDASRTIGPLRVALRDKTVTLPAFRLGARSARLIPAGVAVHPSTPLRMTQTPLRMTQTPLRMTQTPLTTQTPRMTRTPLAATRTASVVTRTASVVTRTASVATRAPSAMMQMAIGMGGEWRLRGGALRVTFAPKAGARVWEFRSGDWNASTSIGLLRDAIDPQPPPSARDYIAPYTHPMPAGTFNRAYACAPYGSGLATGAYCRYDAPDLPAGGARFERWLAIDGDALVVRERLTPNAASPPVHLESISGLACTKGDTFVAPQDADFVAVVHGRQVAAIRWPHGTAARVTVRQTRGARLVTVVAAGATLTLRLEIFSAADAAEALRRLRANPA